MNLIVNYRLIYLYLQSAFGFIIGYFSQVIQLKLIFSPGLIVLETDPRKLVGSILSILSPARKGISPRSTFSIIIPSFSIKLL